MLSLSYHIAGEVLREVQGHALELSEGLVPELKGAEQMCKVISIAHLGDTDCLLLWAEVLLKLARVRTMFVAVSSHLAVRFAQ